MCNAVLTGLLGTAIKSGLLGPLLRMLCSRSRRLSWNTTLVPRFLESAL
jgi:hypothetical protein